MEAQKNDLNGVNKQAVNGICPISIRAGLLKRTGYRVLIMNFTKPLRVG